MQHSTVTISINIVRAATTYCDLQDLYGMWCLLEVLCCCVHVNFNVNFSYGLSCRLGSGSL